VRALVVDGVRLAVGEADADRLAVVDDAAGGVVA
jgi:hypothetical protein